MILQALCEYYDRKAANAEESLAPEGWEWKEIPFLIVLNEKGEFQAIEDTREGEGKKLRAKRFLVPQGEKRTVGIKAYFLWDNLEYALGANPRGREDIDIRHGKFKDRVQEELGVDSLAIITPLRALKNFLDNEPLRQIESKNEYLSIWKEALQSNAFVAFKIEGSEDATICDSVREIIQKRKPNESDSDKDKERVCLITGERSPIAQLHPSIKGVRGTNTQGGSIVSFNLGAFKSFGKEQGLNAPIGERAAFCYTTALNHLLGKDSRNKTSVGDTTMVFWSQKKDSQAYDLESEFQWLLEDSPKDEPDRGVQAVKGLFEAMRSGSIGLPDDNRFYVLGLAPNAARISVRFWKMGSTRSFAEKILRHFEDMQVTRGPNEPEFLSLSRILRSTALEYKMDNVPPNLSASVITSILDGTPYPVTLIQQCIRRIRAERHVTRARAGILKAWINRSPNYSEREVIQVALDRDNNNGGYCLGRLFAVLEKIQEEANPGINATIRDRYYGAASSSPVTVFSQLIKLKNHHLSKLERTGRKVFFEREIGEIVGEIDNFPKHLTLEEQAFFGIGYYHQRQEFFKKNVKEDVATINGEEVHHEQDQ